MPSVVSLQALRPVVQIQLGQDVFVDADHTALTQNHDLSRRSRDNVDQKCISAVKDVDRERGPDLSDVCNNTNEHGIP